VAAGIGLVRRHVADAGRDPGFHLARPQPPEAALGGAHVRADLVFDLIGQPHDARQVGEGAGIHVERRCEPREVLLAIGLGRRHFARAAGFLQGQQVGQLGALIGRAARGRRG
jgi:hypothetical protein